MKEAQTDGWFYQQFDRIAIFLISLALLILVFFAFMAYRFYEIQTLFDEALREMLPGETNRATASILIAIVFVMSTVIFMTHAQKIDSIFSEKNTRASTTKIILVVFALTINLFFWKPWEGKTLADKSFKASVCIMLATMDYAFAHLFNALRDERIAYRSLAAINAALAEAQQQLTSLLAEIDSIKSKEKAIKKLIQKHTCPHCEDIFPTPHSVNAHKTKCPKKP